MWIRSQPAPDPQLTPIRSKGAFKRKESEVLFKDLDTRHYNVDLVQGIGPKKAIELVKKHKSIEEILAHLDKTKYPPPENWMYNEAR